MATPASSVRQKVHELADQLPPNATWGDVRYQVELRASIERGLAESEAGRTTSHAEVAKEFGITE